MERSDWRYQPITDFLYLINPFPIRQDPKERSRLATLFNLHHSKKMKTFLDANLFLDANTFLDANLFLDADLYLDANLSQDYSVNWGGVWW